MTWPKWWTRDSPARKPSLSQQAPPPPQVAEYALVGQAAGVDGVGEAEGAEKSGQTSASRAARVGQDPSLTPLANHSELAELVQFAQAEDGAGVVGRAGEYRCRLRRRMSTSIKISGRTEPDRGGETTVRAR